MPVDLVLKKAKIYVFDRIVDAGLAIDGERIVRVAKESNLPSASERMNLGGLLVLPGAIDVHVHLRDQEQSYKEDFVSGTCAAANGGITLVMDMPNNKPTTMDSITLRERMNLASGRIVVNVAFYSAFPNETEEIKRIVREGAKAFKIFLSHKVGGINPNDKTAVIESFKKASKASVPVAVHAEDGVFLQEKIRELKFGGKSSLDDYLKAHSPEAEIRGIRRVIELTEESGVHVHVCHVSTAEGLKIVADAKERGLKISCEVTPHHLLLSNRHMKKIGNMALTNPPLRSPEEVSSLRSALWNNLIDVVASDHAPHTL